MSERVTRGAFGGLLALAGFSALVSDLFFGAEGMAGYAIVFLIVAALIIRRALYGHY